MDPEERYRRAADALASIQAAEKAALREYHDARHALIAYRAAAPLRARTAADGTGPCPLCGRLLLADGAGGIDGLRPHADPKAGLLCGSARMQARPGR